MFNKYFLKRKDTLKEEMKKKGRDGEKEGGDRIKRREVGEEK